MLAIEDVKKTVSTSPCYGGGASFKTHNLAKTSTGYTFKPSISGITFALVFALVGLGVFSFGIYKLFLNVLLSNLYFY